MKRNSTRAFVLSCIASLACIALVACSRAEPEAKRSFAYANAAGGVDRMKTEVASPAGEAGGMGLLRDEAPAKPEPAPSQPQLKDQSSRKLIKTGSLELESRDLNSAEQKIIDTTKALGGYVAASNSAESYLSMTIRLPQDKFDSGMAGLKGAGRLKSHAENVEDVTLQYVDQESRIATRKILRDRYVDYLKKAGKVEELLSIEKALNDVQSELDSMESTFKALRDQIDYSAISISVSLPPEATPAAERSFLGGLARVWDGFVGFLFFSGYAVVAVILFGVPSIAFLGLLYWLCFGKIGLVRKFFALLSGKKKAG
jgi:hypothetical protein